MTELDEIFAELGLSHYLEVFIEHGFDTWDTILDITESDFNILGVKLGHRRKLQRKIANSRGLSSDQALLSPTRNTPVDDRQSDENKTGISKIDSKDGSSGSSGSNGKRKYRRHPKPDENAPERPPSAYVHFSNKMRADLKGRYLSFTEIAKLVGENWQSLPPNDKEPYESQALNMKDKYNAELAEYKKTEKYRTYVEYLNEFKEKQAGVQHNTSKRPKLEHRVSSGSSGPGSSADSHHGADRPPELARMEPTGSMQDSRPSSGRRPSLPQSLAIVPSITSKDEVAHMDRMQGSPTGHTSGILPGYRDSVYAAGQQQTLAWRDSRLLTNASTQYPNIKIRNDRRTSQPGPPTSDVPHQPDTWLPNDHQAAGGFSPPPLLTSESTAGTTDSNSPSVQYIPRSPLEPPLPALQPLKPYDNQLPPLRSISLSPQSSLDMSYSSPSGIFVLDFPSGQPRRGYPHTYQSPTGSAAAIDSAPPARSVNHADDEVLDPVSALLRAGEIVSRIARQRPPL